VAQLRNYSEAARQNNVPQPKISRCIFALETQLNAKLFYRTNREVSLTREYKNGFTTASITSLKKIADYFEVSPNYLMGFADCPTPEDEAAHRATGLSASAIAKLKQENKKGEAMMATINRLIEEGEKYRIFSFLYLYLNPKVRMHDMDVTVSLPDGINRYAALDIETAEWYDIALLEK
jgi:transcriptional regulator with XRE-family HTH domain